MNAIPPADWEDGIMPVGWKLGYELARDVHLIFLRNGRRVEEPRPDRPYWCYVAGKDKRGRLYDVESKIFDSATAALYTMDELDGEAMRLVEEKNIGSIVEKARAEYL